MSGTATGANLPVTITVTGAQQAEAAISRVGQAGAAAAQSIGRGMSSATTSMTNFVTEVASGGSVLGALGSQAQGFLAAFGPVGVIAGAVVSTGALALSLLRVRDSAEEAQRSSAAFMESLRDSDNRTRNVIREINDLLLTSAERATNAANAQRRALEATARTQLAETMGRSEALPAQLADLQRRAERAEVQLRTAEREAENARRSGQPVPQDALIAARQAEDAARTERNNLLERMRADAARVTQLEESIRAAAGSVGPDQFGPNLPPREARSAPSGATYAAPTDDDMRARLQSGVGGPRDRAIEEMRQFERQQELINAGIERAGPIFSAHERQIEMFTRALNAGVITEDQFSQMVERSTEQLDRQIVQLKNRGEGVNNMGRDLGMTFSSAFEDAILKGRRFSDVLKSIAQDIARIIVRQSITAPLGNALSNAFGSLDFGRMFSGMFGGARAEGGPVFSGRAYMVGERGPELFVPGTAGGIVPNSGGITVNQSFSVDARGADQGVIPRLRAEMIAIAQASNAQLLDAIQRGGSVAKTVGRRA